MGKFKCTQCPRSYGDKKGLGVHIWRNHTEDHRKPFHCKKCLDPESNKPTKYFTLQRDFQRHMKRVHGDQTASGRFKCEQCFKSFYDSHRLGVHKETHNQNRVKRFKCDLCPRSFHSKYSLQHHLFKVHNKQDIKGVKYLKCEFCSQEFQFKSLLEKHVVAMHVVDKTFECPVCPKTFIDEETLKKHMVNHDNPIQFFCDVCSHGFKSKIGLKSHLGVQHKKFFYCNHCLYSFKNKSEFNQHQDNRKRKASFKCQFCNEKFPSQCNLDNHTNSHLREIETEQATKTETKTVKQIDRPEKEHQLLEFKCELCSKTYDREAYIVAHRREAHANHVWKCDFAECFAATFKTHNRWQKHQTFCHSDTKNFVCSICLKSYFLLAQLKRHHKRHLTHKKIKCQKCPATFSSDAALKVHVLKVCKKHKGHQSDSDSDDNNASLIKIETVVKSEALEDAAVFPCHVNECNFESLDLKEVAIHNNQEHQLPKVLMFRIFLVKIER